MIFNSSQHLEIFDYYPGILPWRDMRCGPTFSNEHPYIRILFHAYHIMPDMAHEFYQRYAHLFTNDILFTIDEFRDIQTLRILLQMGMRVDVPNALGFSLLHVACSEIDLAMVKLLLEYNADVNQINNCTDDTHCGESALNSIVRMRGLEADMQNRQLEIIRLLLENRANVNNANQNPNCTYYLDTPLHEAARQGNVAMIRLLLDNGANIYAINRQGNTPYDSAQDHHVDLPDEIWNLLNPNPVAQEPQPAPQNEAIVPQAVQTPAATAVEQDPVALHRPQEINPTHYRTAALTTLLLAILYMMTWHTAGSTM
jgi:hypothetical protein